MISKNRILVKENLELIKVNPNDEKHCQILYELLSKRSFKISHKNMPTYLVHLEFMKNIPYRKWFLIYYKEKFIGSIYILFDNGIGLDMATKNYNLIYPILNKVFVEIKPLKSIPSLRIANYHINVAPANIKLKETIEKLGAELKQETFIFNFD